MMDRWRDQVAQATDREDLERGPRYTRGGAEGYRPGGLPDFSSRTNRRGNSEDEVRREWPGGLEDPDAGHGRR